jgi:DNA-binding transcriptional regulator YdaS (Cro superfamily)
MTTNIKQTLLLRAEKLLHGREKLAEALGVGEPLLDAWMSGAVDMPEVKMPRLSAILAKAGDQTRGGFS